MAVCNNHKQDTVINDLFHTEEGADILSRASYIMSNETDTDTRHTYQSIVIRSFRNHFYFLICFPMRSCNFNKQYFRLQIVVNFGILSL